MDLVGTLDGLYEVDVVLLTSQGAYLYSGAASGRRRGRTLPRMGSGEKHYERRAADAVGRALGRALRRYETERHGDDSLDYIDDHDEVYEMKSVIPQEYEELCVQRASWYPSTRLAMHWSILILAPTMDDKFRPVPNFPDDDPSMIAEIEADGSFTVTRKAEREAEWRRRYSGGPLAVARIGKREREDSSSNTSLFWNRAGSPARAARSPRRRRSVRQSPMFTV